jgi:IS30 family transposase
MIFSASAGHEKIKAALNANSSTLNQFYSWERGLSKNTNGLNRQYFTKGNSFENIANRDFDEIVEKLNHQHRKTLNYLCPVVQHTIRSLLLMLCQRLNDN